MGFKGFQTLVGGRRNEFCSVSSAFGQTNMNNTQRVRKVSRGFTGGDGGERVVSAAILDYPESSLQELRCACFHVVMHSLDRSSEALICFGCMGDG